MQEDRLERVKMAGDLTSDFRGLLAGKVNLPGTIESLSVAYKNSSPFPHVVIDNMFSTELLDSILSEMSELGSDQWLRIEQDQRERTFRMRSGAELRSAGEKLVSIVHSAAFLYLLSEITGVWQLLPDPYFQGAGYAQMRRGDYFNIHSDRSVAYDTGLTRRLAMIIFLNKDWGPDYKGQLELWNSGATRCEVSVDPLYNRTIIFEVANPNYHGVPTPLACPPDRRRQSFILYFHTVGLNDKANVKPHSSIFAPRFYGSNRMTLRSSVRELLPPVLVRAFRRIFKSDY